MRAWQGLLPSAAAAVLLISGTAGPAPVTLEDRVTGCQNMGGAVSECITTAAAAAGIPACESEDAPGPCRWDAAAAGDGSGNSFTVLESGDVVYDSRYFLRLYPYCADTGFQGPCLEPESEHGPGFLIEPGNEDVILLLGA